MCTDKFVSKLCNVVETLPRWFTDGHPSKYQPGPVSINYIAQSQHTNQPLHYTATTVAELVPVTMLIHQ